MIFLGILFGFLIPYLIITIKGPSIWDRLLGMNLITTKVTLIVVLFASLYDMPFLTDYAVILTLLGFISSFFITVYWVKHKARKK